MKKELTDRDIDRLKEKLDDCWSDLVDEVNRLREIIEEKDDEIINLQATIADIQERRGLI